MTHTEWTKSKQNISNIAPKSFSISPGNASVSVCVYASPFGCVSKKQPSIADEEKRWRGEKEKRKVTNNHKKPFWLLINQFFNDIMCVRLVGLLYRNALDVCARSRPFMTFCIYSCSLPIDSSDRVKCDRQVVGGHDDVMCVCRACGRGHCCWCIGLSTYCCVTANQHVKHKKMPGQFSTIYCESKSSGTVLGMAWLGTNWISLAFRWWLGRFENQ